MRVDFQKSVFVAGQHPAIPSAKRNAVRLWGYLSGIVAISGVVIAFIAGWYWALVGIIAAVIIVRGNQASAAQFISEVAESNPAFRAEMVSAGILRYPQTAVGGSGGGAE